MEQRLESALVAHIPVICEGCHQVIEGFSVFRIEDKSPDWGGRKRIARYCLGCSEYKEEVDKLMEGMLW